MGIDNTAAKMLLLLRSIPEIDLRNVLTLRHQKNYVSIGLQKRKYSTIKSADRILYLQDGKLISFGNWNQVLSEVPQFALQARIQGL